MSTNSFKIPPTTPMQTGDATGPPLALRHDPPPLDWRHAVDAAGARLDESWVCPDTTGYMIASGLAVELAAMLSAFGQTAAEAEHMRLRTEAMLAADVRRALEHSLADPAGLTGELPGVSV
jgi:hypothetical protein